MYEQMIGHKLGRYRIASLIGAGGMGSVLKAFDETLQRDVAIKILAPQYTRQPNFRDRFLQEARTAARLRHPGIVQVYDFGQSPSLLYIVMEYIQGDDLQVLLRRLNKKNQRIILTESVALTREVSQAVDYAHKHGVLHRDIKPANVMLRDEPSSDLPYQPILTDLGLAKLAEGGVVTQIGTSMGTPTYMSPEQAMGDEVDSRSDVYSLGILMYELAVGKPPFKVKSITEAIRYHSKTPPPPPRSVRPEIPKALEAVILKALRKKPENRYKDARNFAEALDEALDKMEMRRVPETPIPASVSLFTLYEPPESEQYQAVGVSTAAEGLPPIRLPDQLVILMSDQTSRTINLKSDKFTIGRDNTNDLVINERKISRNHVRIEFDGADYRIIDLNSTNGSFLNDLKLLPDVPEVWSTGGVLRVGDAWIRLERRQGQAVPRDPFADRNVITNGVLQASTGTGLVGIYIESDKLSASPGEELAIQIMVLNQGRLVDRFETSVQGIPDEWIASLPDPVHLMPGEQKTVELAINPPRTYSSRAGQHSMMVRVSSQADPSQVAELKLAVEIAPYNQFALELRPRTQTDISSAIFKAFVENSGNFPLVVTMEALGHEPGLILSFDKNQLTIQPGETGSATLTARSQTPQVGDQVRRHFFTVTSRPQHAPELAQQTQGEWEQGLPSFEISLDPETQQGALSGTYTITLVNQGRDDLQIQLEAKDPAAACQYNIEPTNLRVLAGQRAASQLSVRAKSPLSSEKSQVVKFTVLARPDEAPSSVSQVDGEWVQIPPTYTAGIRPEIQQGSASARYSVRLENLAEVKLTLHLEASDREEACHFEFNPDVVAVAPMSRVEVPLIVTPKQSLTTDLPKTHPFIVSVYPSEAPGLMRKLEAEFRQQPPVFEIAIAPDNIESRNKGVAQVNLVNKSDLELSIRLEGSDNSSSCLFEFQPNPCRVAPAGTSSSTMVAQTKSKLEGKESVFHEISVSGTPSEAPASVKSGHVRWVQIPGGRSLATTVILMIAAWIVVIAGWSVAWGMIQALLGTDTFFEPVSQLAEFGLDEQAASALVAMFYAALGGIIGGFLTGLAVRIVEPSLKFIQVLLIALGWMLAFAVAAFIDVFLS